MSIPGEEKPASRFRARLHEVIFESETRSGRGFDLALLWFIVASVLVVCIESVPAYRRAHGPLLHRVEWGFTILFSIEYVLRLFAVRRPWRYATSFFGAVDVLAILPTVVGMFIPGAQSLLVVRILRLLRVFRILKLASFLVEADVLLRAMKASRQKVTVFLLAVMGIVVVTGAVMYLVEGEKSGFDSIPRSIYWAIVTLTTVGFGDIAPKTPLGQALASVLMVTGYGFIAVPTGIVSVEIANAARLPSLTSSRACLACGAQGHDADARHCKYCGGPL